MGEALDLVLPEEKHEPHVWAMLELACRNGKKDGDKVVMPAKFYPRPTALNCAYILENDSRWAGKVKVNEFTGALECHGSPVARDGELEDVDYTAASNWLERVYGLVADEKRVSRQLRLAGGYHGYHPVRDYLEGLKWDGEPRVLYLLSDYFRADNTHLHQTLSRCWLVSCVARILPRGELGGPGCKVDTTLVLVGAQGARKSSAVEALARGWYSDTMLDLGSKDTYQALYGVWLYELAEVDMFARGEWSKAKALISSKIDRFRLPYAQHFSRWKRQSVFVATTNQKEFLGDETGSRRFWPVRVGDIDLEAIQADVDQLWAEAVHMYREGAQWWLTREEAADLREASEDFQVRHPWHDSVAEYCVGRDVVQLEDVLSRVLDKPVRDWNNADRKVVYGILKSLGYESTSRRIGGIVRRVWVLS